MFPTCHGNSTICPRRGARPDPRDAALWNRGGRHEGRRPQAPHGLQARAEDRRYVAQASPVPDRERLRVPDVLHHGFVYDIHKFYLTGPFYAETGTLLYEFFSFAVVRHPVARLVSACRARIVDARQASRGRLGRQAISRGAVPDPDFATFCDRLELYREVSEDLRHHTQPMTFFLCRDPWVCSRLHRFSELRQPQRT
jgi:hypothetical protein